MEKFSYIPISEQYNNEDFIEALKSSDLVLMKKLLDSGKDIEMQDSYGRTPLMISSLFNLVESTRFLILNGANIETKDFDGETALVYAVRNVCIEVVEVLLINGANVEIVADNGFTLFDWISIGEKSEKMTRIVEMLKNHDVYKLKGKVESSMTKPTKNSGIF